MKLFTFIILLFSSVQVLGDKILIQGTKTNRYDKNNLTSIKDRFGQELVVPANKVKSNKVKLELSPLEFKKLRDDCKKKLKGEMSDLCPPSL